MIEAPVTKALLHLLRRVTIAPGLPYSNLDRHISNIALFEIASFLFIMLFQCSHPTSHVNNRNDNDNLFYSITHMRSKK